MTTEEMLEALSKVPCLVTDGHMVQQTTPWSTPKHHPNCTCHGTGRMFPRLVEKFPWANRPALPHPIEKGCCDGSGWRLIQHDRLDAVMESGPGFTLFWSESEKRWCCEYWNEDASTTARLADTPLDAAVAALFQWAVNQDHIQEAIIG